VYDPKYINVSLHWFRWLIVGFSARGHWFDPEPVYIKFVVDAGALQQDFLRVDQIFSVSIIALLLHTQFPSRIISKKQIWEISDIVRGGADKSLAQPGRKQATATKLGIYLTYSPRSSIHFLACCCNFCKPIKKKSECFPSN